ncbi:phosphatidylserine/phosphatidylglycerophosphate/cardiolipin synthase-like enzyme [Nocardioides sp. BE266]|uniref:phospholipase D-like domain-containing protein n=1 Tax=Nocardioides sp. BE266 TaxID=2817725 RepID=UPI00285B7026|nr:phospholipase D-like domain-containing protein [Nocardioides sp. BE266]MDR7255148.1 phosphatidylserine/phosphatidylglycerophosphate/cardiolipin synthase-like enzyme [Nocardioides sp. BE266]
MSKFSRLVGSLCLVLVASMVAAGPGAASSDGSSGADQGSAAVAAHAKPKPKKWKAPKGPYFNDPHLRKGWFNIERRVVDTIRHTPKGSTIRIAIYSLDRMPVAKALVEAHRRGVKVQMLLNDHWENRAMKVIRAEIGKNRRKDSFIYKCKASCRGAKNEFNNLHSKFYLFSQAGKAQDLIAVGSANMTLNADRHQWNDLHFSDGNHVLFRQFVSLFNDMKKDYSTRQPPMYFCGTPVTGVCDDSVDKNTTWVFPKNSGPKNDLVIDLLNKVQCLTPDGNGGQTRTHLALSMHTMRGARGDYLAAAIRRKYAEGCDFRVSYGLIGFHTKGVLGAPTRRGRIPLRSTGLDYNTDDNFDLNNDGIDDLILDYYTHQKYLVIQGTYNGVPDTSMVLTGSVNWSSLSTANDEVWFTVRGARVAKKYLKNFNYQWNSPRNSRNAYTTTYANFRVARWVEGPDGTRRKVWRTVRRKVTTVEPDHMLKGPYWEND